MDGNKRKTIAAVSAIILVLGLVSIQTLQSERVAGAFAGGSNDLHMPFVPRNMLAGLGTVQGFVVDAITGNPIDGAEVCSEFGDCEITDVQGFYRFSNIPLGYREFEAMADTGVVQYLDLSRSVQVKGGPPNILNFALSPDDLDPDLGQYRIVLSWGDDPADLDAHLWTPDDISWDGNNNGVLDPGETRPHIYSAHRGHCENPPGPVFDRSSACLERDERNGFGPETIKINEAQIGIYYFAVQRFEPACINPNPPPFFINCPTPLEQSGAIVQVYDGTGLRLFKVVPSSNPDGKFYWYVFQLEFGLAGEVGFTEIDCFLDEPDPIDSPPVCPP